MRRRTLLAGLLGGGVVGGGILASRRGGPSGAVDPESSDEQDSDAPGVQSRELDRLDPIWEGSGTMTVPERGVVTNVEIMRTTCSGCYRKLPHLPLVYDQYGDQIQMVSVLIDEIPAETDSQWFVDVWTEHGDWPLVHDPISNAPDHTIIEINDQLDGVLLASPSSVVLDEDNQVVWQNVGGSAAPVVEELARAIGEHV